MLEQKSLKLFYNKYKYRIHLTNAVEYAEKFGHITNTTDWWKSETRLKYIDIARSTYSMLKKYLKDKNIDFRSREEWGISVFLTDETEFEYIKKRFSDWIDEVSVPYRDDLVEIVAGLPQESEIRNSLYNKEFRYKLIFDVVYDKRQDATNEVVDLVKNLQKYQLSSSLLWDIRDRLRNSNKMGYTQVIHPWTDHYILFEDEETVAYAAMMLHNVRIKKVKKAVLKSELE